MHYIVFRLINLSNLVFPKPVGPFVRDLRYYLQVDAWEEWTASM